MSSSRLFLDGMLSSSARLRFARPRSECVKVVLPVEKFAANGELSLNCLSHPRGQPHYAHLRQVGHNHGRALRGVADRLLAVLIAMLKSGQTYDPNRRSTADLTTA
jgi:hypothetical protein